ncbi:hypothetical protein AARI_23190 [Glutamicibacter arilaitensis Re117]|jgi:hypothetical protein|uniref:Uncharacterized protein n=1 Tax=Glutamicibacter arilaitensis (strain DSM 16368 / CIP 108037 / IAM 15318 / JCM 13566 / NCIMB 14258 / Re117) TaxID=861360 RepID=A0ABM9PYU3_GLUAR|nr:hypothetical protein AARI_23190 [Glutamicibacter arilaitensis Re117]
MLPSWQQLVKAKDSRWFLADPTGIFFTSKGDELQLEGA